MIDPRRDMTTEQREWYNEGWQAFYVRCEKSVWWSGWWSGVGMTGVFATVTFLVIHYLRAR